MKLYGLIGFPLSHSFSKKYFSEKFDREHLSGHRYELFPIDNIDLLNEAVLQPHPELCGLNVTIPYKKAILPFLHDRSHLPLDACNCIKITHGFLSGFNTDVFGFEQSLKSLLQISHAPALVLGTGGASEAVVFVLIKLGIDFTMVSRVKKENTLTYDEITGDMLAHYKLIVNCTPIGTYPNMEESPSLPYDAIGTEHYLFDLVYNPAETRFLREGALRGATIKNGFDMLALQAEESWRIWNDPEL